MSTIAVAERTRARRLVGGKGGAEASIVGSTVAVGSGVGVDCAGVDVARSVDVGPGIAVTGDGVAVPPPMTR